MKKHVNCTIEGCNNETFNNEDKCALHCDKNNYSVDRDNHGLLSSFFNLLIEYIIGEIEGLKEYGVRTFTDDDKKKEAKRSLKHGVKIDYCELIRFNLIKFPARDERENFDYFKTLKSLNMIQYHECEFWESCFDIENVEMFFQDCIFHNNWEISNIKYLTNVSKSMYHRCKFDNNVRCSSNNKEKVEIDYNIFKECTFKQSLKFINVQLNAWPFLPGSIKIKIRGNRLEKKTVKVETQIKIQSLDIVNCIFENGLYLNNSNIKGIYISNTVFKEKFELKHSCIKYLMLNDSNFEGIYDSYYSVFKYISFERIVFNDFAEFEHCKFGTLEDYNTELNAKPAEFKYVTFLDFSNFRNTKFITGLNFEDTNLKQPPNFLNSEIEFNGTNRETYRIIKHSFDNSGNYIDGNKFYSDEMRAYNRELFLEIKKKYQ